MTYFAQSSYFVAPLVSYASKPMYSIAAIHEPVFVNHERSMSNFTGLDYGSSQLAVKTLNYKSPSHYAPPSSQYEGTNNNSEIQTITHIDQPTTFLNPKRSPTKFIGKAGEVKEFMLQTWDHLMHKEFPSDIDIQILSQKEMKEKLKENYHPGILGFAINGHNTYSRSKVYVKQGDLDIVLETLGHELGHVLTPQLPNEIDEEAKAYSFEAAWVKVIKEWNIAGLQNNFKDIPEPARNGIHNVAAKFVGEKCKEFSALEVFEKVSRKVLSSI